MSFEECLRKKLLVRVKPQIDLSEKEFNSAKKDLERARHTQEIDRDSKWAIIKAYYSMFHAAKAILYLVGLRERSHGCVAATLEKLSEKGLIESSVVEEFKSRMEAREDADYRNEYSEEEAERSIQIAKKFLNKMKELSGKVKPSENSNK